LNKRRFIPEVVCSRRLQPARLQTVFPETLQQKNNQKRKYKREKLGAFAGEGIEYQGNRYRQSKREIEARAFSPDTPIYQKNEQSQNEGSEKDDALKIEGMVYLIIGLSA
jgi:hypothetical protein